MHFIQKQLTIMIVNSKNMIKFFFTNKANTNPQLKQDTI